MTKMMKRSTALFQDRRRLMDRWVKRRKLIQKKQESLKKGVFTFCPLIITQNNNNDNINDSNNDNTNNNDNDSNNNNNKNNNNTNTNNNNNNTN